MPSQVVIECSELLKENKLTIAFAESATAGRLAAEFSMTEASGSILKGGVVCYDAEVKQDVLNIDPGLLNVYTPESEEVTRELALQLRDLIKSDIQVAVTGLTTPGGSESPEKPVGSMFIHILFKGNSIAVKEVFSGSPEQVVLMAGDLAAKTIINELKLSAR